MCVLTVFSLMTNVSAISRLLRPSRHQPDDLELALGEIVRRRAPAGGPPRPPALPPPPPPSPCAGRRGAGAARRGARRGWPRPASSGVTVLEQVARGAGLEGRQHLVVPGEAGQRDHPDAGLRLLDAPRGLDPVQPRHDEVHEHDVRARAGRQPPPRSRPSAASPTTAMSSCRSRKVRSPWRTTWWSSTITTLIVPVSATVIASLVGPPLPRPLPPPPGCLPPRALVTVRRQPISAARSFMMPRPSPPPATSTSKPRPSVRPSRRGRTPQAQAHLRLRRRRRASRRCSAPPARCAGAAPARPRAAAGGRRPPRSVTVRPSCAACAPSQVPAQARRRGRRRRAAESGLGAQRGQLVPGRSRRAARAGRAARRPPPVDGRSSSAADRAVERHAEERLRHRVVQVARQPLTLARSRQALGLPS